MEDVRPKKFWRVSRRIFRWTRIVCLFFLFLVVFTVVYVHEIGIPGFIRKPILEQLRNTGVDIEFDNMRWSWPNRIHFDAPSLSSLTNSALKLAASGLDFEVDLASASRKQLRIDSFSLKQGTLTVPLSNTNTNTLLLTNLSTAIYFLGSNTLRIQNLGGQLDGASVHIDGTLTNYSAVMNWPMFHRTPSTNKPEKSSLEQFTETWSQLKFSTPPALSLHFGGNGTNVDSIKLAVDVVADSLTETPWGRVTDLKLKGHYAAQTNADSKAILELSGTAKEIVTTNGIAQGAMIDVTVWPVTTNLWQGDVSLDTRHIDAHWVASNTTNYVRGTNLQWRGTVVASSRGKIQYVGGQAQLLAAESIWGTAQQVTADVKITKQEEVGSRDTWGFWSPLARWIADWKLDVTQLNAARLEVSHLVCDGEWSIPNLLLRNVEMRLYDGAVKGSANLDVDKREARIKAASNFDPQKISALLPTEAQQWLKEIKWRRPPEITADVAATLPSWTKRGTNWVSKMLPTVKLLASVSTGPTTFRGVDLTSLKTDLVCSNRRWQIPNFSVVRPEGRLDLSLKFNARNSNQLWKVDSTIDPNAFTHWLSPDLKDIFSKIRIGGPPEIHAEILERDFNFKACSLKAQVIATNVGYKEVDLDRLAIGVSYSNQFLAFSNAKLEKDEKIITCPNAEIDFKEGRVFLHEVYSTMEPMPITRAIGRKVAEAIEPYHFHRTPTVYVDGNFVFDHPETADMHFLVEGEQFEWGLLKAEKATGKVDWIGETLYVTNIVAEAYRGGNFEGWVFVDFRTRPGNDFQIGISFTNLDVKTAMRDLGKTNGLEGILHGKVNLTHANTKLKDTWEGFGWLQLQEGFIWDVPVFGIFSPVLNAIVPGSGSSRAGEASGSFLMTNSIIRSDDLEIRSPAVRINYRGTVDFNEQVDARVEAQVLRDAGSLGHLFSIALQPLTKIFEYKLSGTLEDPQSEPVFIPNFLMKILRPFKTLKRILPEKTESSTTQAAPAAEAKASP